MVRPPLGEAIRKYTESPPKGEFVLVVAGAAPEAKTASTAEDGAARALELMESGMSRKDAARQAAKELGLQKNLVYDATLK